MSTVGRVARVVTTVVLLGILLISQLRGHDDWWPLGMLGQYGVARDPDGQVIDTYLVGELADGGRQELPLRVSETGLARVELELALPGLREDPSGLEDVATAYERAHPGVDVTALEVRQHIHTLRNGGRDGPPEDVLAVRWEEP